MTLLNCPSCGENGNLSTIENITGLSGLINVDSDTGLEFSGETEVLFDTSTTIGVQCQCGWDCEGSDWEEKLAQ